MVALKMGRMNANSRHTPHYLQSASGILCLVIVTSQGRRCLVVFFLLNGNILLGLWKDLLIACVSKDSYEAALLKAYVGDSTLLASQ